MKKPIMIASRIPVWVIITLFIAEVIICSLCSGCKTTKDIQTAKATFDSTYIKKSDSLLKINSRLKTTYEKQISDLKKNTVKFVNPPPCPTVKIDSTCNQDSMVKIIRQLEAIIASQKNTIKVNADGSYELQGQLRSFQLLQDRKEKQVDSMTIDYNSLQRFKDSVAASKTTVTTSTVKKIKRSFLNSFGFWALLFIAGLVTGYIIRKKTAK